MENKVEFPEENNELKKQVEDLKEAHPEIVDELKDNIKEIILQGEALSLSKFNSNPALDFVSKLNDNQRDKLIDIFAKNEDNSITYHTKRIEAYKEVEIEKIKSRGVGIKNVKQIFFGLILTFALITILLIFFKSDFLPQWFAFIVGLGGGSVGGFGLGKSGFFNTNSNNSNKELNKDEA